MIEGKEQFKKALRGAGEKEVFINVELSNGKDVYFCYYDDLLKIKNICSSEDLTLSRLALQFRSHLEEIDIANAEAVYLVRSVMGQIGERSKSYCYTMQDLYQSIVVGLLRDGEVLVQKIKTRDGLKLKFIEPDFLDSRLNKDISDTRQIRMGVEI